MKKLLEQYDEGMPLKQAIRAVSKARTIYAWAKLFKEDAVYLRVQKAEVLRVLRESLSHMKPGDDEILVVVEERNGDVYIN